MTPSRDLFTRIRAALEEEVGRTSLRAVARELEMSATGLRKFLNGTQPHSATCERVLAWYLRHAARCGEMDAEMATAALELLVGPAARAVPELVPQLLRLLASGYQAAGLVEPDWLVVHERVDAG